MATSSRRGPLGSFHPALAAWFTDAFGKPTPVQLDAWQSIRRGEHTLIAAPTGSGKTLAALLPCLDRIVQAKLAGRAPAGVRVVYVTPLKALNNDIHHHIEAFVAAIDAQAAVGGSGSDWPGLRSAVRTGDTKSSQRVAMLRQPPDVLVTTPESLYILLTSAKGRDMLRTTEQVIVDEIHDLAPDKRGAHLSLTLERLVHACGRPVQRIGVSATQRPLSRVARFLGGWEPAESTGDDRGTEVPMASTSDGRGATETMASADGSHRTALARANADDDREASQESADESHGAEEPKVSSSDRRKATVAMNVVDGDHSDSREAAQQIASDDGSNAAAAPALSAIGAPRPDALADDAASEEQAFRHPLGYRPRPVAVIESPMDKALEVRVTMPDPSLALTTRESVWYPLLDRILQLMEGCRSVLIFTVSRRLCERLTLRLNDYVGHEMAKSHHGSLARERRLAVEQQLKAGELRAIVATSSLELGIDVGHIDLVIQIDSPLSAASGIQRIGRAGHQVGAASRGYLLVRHPGGLPEVAMLARKIRERDIEEIEIPRQPLDVLSQQTVALTAMDDWTTTELYRLVMRSDSYRALPLDRLQAMLRVLSGWYPFARPLLGWEREQDRLTRLRGTAMAALTGAGTIPQSSGYPVHHADSRVHLGELDEEFVHESRVGDVFQLGTSSWMIREIRKDRIYVAETTNSFSEIPFWRNEAGGRSFELGETLGRLLAELHRRLEADSGSEGHPEQTLAWLDAEYGMDARSGERFIELIRSQAAATPLPTDTRLVVEHYEDLQGKTHVVLHNHWGRRLNRTWQLALERQIQQTLPYRIYSNATDSGLEFVVPNWDASWLQLLWQVTPETVEELLLAAVPGSPLLAIAFRRIAETSLLLSRSFTRTPMWQKRLRSEELLKESLPYAEQFPYLQEAMRECLHTYLDLGTLRTQLARIQRGEIAIEVCETRRPSPMAARFVEDYANMQLYEGEGLDPSTQLQLMSVSRDWASRLFGQEVLEQALDPEVLAEERQRLAEPAQRPGDAGELLAMLKRRGDASTDELIRLSGDAAARDWLRELESAGLVAELRFGTETRWLCSDELELYEQFPTTPATVALVAGRFAEYRMSFTAADLQERYPALTDGETSQVIEELQRQDKIEQAPFASHPDEPLWSSRKVASRIVRLSIQAARRQGTAVSPERWCTQMTIMQHVAQSSRLSGSEGLRSVIEQLQGLFLPLSHWESIILPARLQDYRPDALDLLCASGEVIWLGRKDRDEKEGKVAFFLTESKALYLPYLQQLGEPEDSRHPELLQLVRRLGATFITRLGRELDLPPSELLERLLDLVWEGHVAGDQFAPLRLHGVRRSKKFDKLGTGQGRWYWTGSLLETEDTGLTSESAADKALASSGPSESALQWVHHLLQSHGILTRELVQQASPFDWETLLPVMRQLEEWGAVSRGRFILDKQAMQFTSRELMAAMRSPLQAGSEETTLLSAVDPANPYGLIADWPADPGTAYARKSGNYLVLKGERWVAWIENNGRRITLRTPQESVDTDETVHSTAAATTAIAARARTEASASPLTASELAPLLRRILQQQSLSKVKVERWNGEPVDQSEGAALLHELGAERDGKTLVLWPSQLR